MSSEQWLYYVSLLSGAVLFWVAWNMVRHRPGRAMRAIRDGEVAAAASGINVAGYKTLAFGMSAFYAGVAGSLYGLSTGFVSPDTFPVALSFQILVGTVIGGLGAIVGPLAGGVFVYWLPIVSSQTISAQDWIPSQISSVFVKAGPAVTYGALLIVIMIFAPNGIVGLASTAYRALRNRLRGAAEIGTGQMPPDHHTV
jgi:branched-chain amino acid transport system permease protein